MGKDVLFTIDPKIGKSFLGWVEDLSQITKASFLIQDFVSFRKLLAVGAWSTISFEYFTQPLNLVKKSLTCSLTILWVKVIFLVSSLFEMITHHDGVFKKQEVWGSSKLFNLCEWSWGSCLSSYRNQLWELKVILAYIVCVLTIHWTLPIHRVKISQVSRRAESCNFFNSFQNHALPSHALTLLSPLLLQNLLSTCN